MAFVRSLAYDTDALHFLIELFGAKRISLESDYPFPLGETNPEKLIDSIGDLTGDVKARLLSQAALQILGNGASWPAR